MTDPYAPLQGDGQQRYTQPRVPYTDGKPSYPGNPQPKDPEDGDDPFSAVIMPPMHFTERERELLDYGLAVRLDYIRGTGIFQRRYQDERKRVKELDNDQIQLVAEILKLRKKLE